LGWICPRASNVHTASDGVDGWSASNVGEIELRNLLGSGISSFEGGGDRVK